MLRFRPIAPKPAGGDAVSSAAEQERQNGVVINGRRTKRKYVRNRPPKRSNKRKIREIGDLSTPEKSGIEDESTPEKGLVTLQLLPERSESSDNSTAKKAHENWNNIDLYTSLDDDFTHKKLNSGVDGTAEMLSVRYKLCDNSTVKIKTDQENWNNIDPHYTLSDNASYRRSDDGGGGMEDLNSVRSVSETQIIVESVTDTTYIESGMGLGFSDRDKINDLQVDTCPGFVSDGTHNVVWVNQAYRKMVGDDNNGFMVRLVVKERLPHFCPSFACRVRLIQHRKQGHNWNKIVPCDVWRMEYFAGFAWKLDVNAALGLAI